MFLEYSRSFAATLWLQHTVHLMLQHTVHLMLHHTLYIFNIYSTFPNVRVRKYVRAVPSMAAVYSSFMSFFPGMLPRYCLNFPEMVSVKPTSTGIY
jgi:hypothetical protein